MKKNLVYLLICTCSILKMQAQNLVRNGSFEEVDPAAISVTGHPNRQADMPACANWTVDQNGDCNSSYYHSPEWFKNEGDKFKARVVTNQQFDVSGNTGTGYAGMAYGELIEQRLDDDLRGSDLYHISMYVRLETDIIGVPITDLFCLNAGGFQASINGNSWTGPGSINLLLGREKIKYANLAPQSSTDIYYLCETNNWLLKESSSSQLVVTAARMPLVTACGLYQWCKIEADFACPGGGFDWIAIESDACDNYVLIDDIEITHVQNRTCEECQTCSQYDGCINPSFNAIHSFTSQLEGFLIMPFTIFNIDNVKYIDLEFRTIGGQLFNHYKIMYPLSPFRWNGKDFWWNEIPTTDFMVYYTMSNDCQTIEGKIKVQKDHTEETDYLPDIMNYGSFYKADDPCCKSDIYLNNYELLNGGMQQPLQMNGINDIRAINSIQVGPNVVFEYASNTTLWAPRIRTRQIVTTNPGAVVSQVVAICSFRPANSKLLTADFLVPQGNNCGELQTYPNPSEGITNIINDGLIIQGKSLSVKIFNTLGQVVKEQFFQSWEPNDYLELTGIPAGIYNVLFEQDNCKFTSKIAVL